MDVTIFRELRGVAEIEASVSMLDDTDDGIDESLAADCNALSRRLFGITLSDTFAPPLPANTLFRDRLRAEDEWEKNFAWLHAEDSEQEDQFWQAVGIEWAAEDGTYLNCFHLVARQAVCAVKSLHPDASLRFRRGELTDEQAEAEAQAWLAKLLT